MVSTLARSIFLLFLAMMLVSWALTLGKPAPKQPTHGSVTFYLVA